MKKKIVISLLLSTFIFIITGCSDHKKLIEDMKLNNTTNINESEIENNMETITRINLTIDNKNYNVILEDNETTQAFLKLLPQEFNMNELNGNEKYTYMENSLPTNAFNPKHIIAGDIMLYGNNCLVIFYQSFDTSYSYTKIGHIENLPDLGNDNITLKFDK